MQPNIEHPGKDHAVIYLNDDHISWIKELLKDKLAEICYGNSKIQLEADQYTYHRACKHIAEQLSSRQNIHKYAIIAEIIMHLIAPTMLTFHAKSLSVILSLQDQNIKHGFDLNFYDEEKRRIWYGEVKAGYNQTRQDLINRAKKDLKDYFNNINSEGKKNTEYRWEAAKNEAITMFFSDSRLQDFLTLYSTNKEEIKNKSSKKRNALIMIVNFGASNHPENHEDIQKCINQIKSERCFNECIVLSALKEQFEDIILFLEQEGKDI